MFKRKSPSLVQTQQKKIYDQNKQQLIDANTSVDQLLSLLINHFEQQFTDFHPNLVNELKNAKRHMQNLNFIFRKM